MSVRLRERDGVLCGRKFHQGGRYYRRLHRQVVGERLVTLETGTNGTVVAIAVSGTMFMWAERSPRREVLP